MTSATPVLLRPSRRSFWWHWLREMTRQWGACLRARVRSGAVCREDALGEVVGTEREKMHTLRGWVGREDGGLNLAHHAGPRKSGCLAVLAQVTMRARPETEGLIEFSAPRDHRAE